MQVNYTRLVLGFSSALDKLHLDRPSTLSLVTMSFFWQYMLKDKAVRHAEQRIELEN